MADYSVRPADLERDAESIIGVWARNLTSHDEATHRKKFAWYYKQSPIGAGRCWVLTAGENGPVVGTAGLGTRHVRVQGRTMIAGLASDFAVDKDHRSLRPALMLARSVLGVLGAGVDFIYGLPNSQSAGVFKRVGYSLDNAMSRHVKVLRVERFLRPRLKSRVLSSAVAGVVNPVSRALSAETWRSRTSTVQQVQRFDAEFDGLWRRAATDYEVVSERTAAFLNWRYIDCPLHAYTVLAVHRPNQLLGYAVGLARSDEQLTVVDVFGQRAPGVCEELLAQVIRWARRSGMASVACEFAGSSELERCLTRMGFRPRGSGASLAIVSATGPSGVAELKSWPFLLADEDFN